MLVKGIITYKTNGWVLNGSESASNRAFVLCPELFGKVYVQSHPTNSSRKPEFVQKAFLNEIYIIIVGTYK